MKNASRDTKRSRSKLLSRPRSRAGGFSFLEILVVTGIISGIFVGTYGYMSATRVSVRISTAVQDIQAIRAAADNWSTGRADYYKDISMSKLSHMLPTKLAEGEKANPWRGNYAVAVEGEDDTIYAITLTGVPTEVGDALQDRLNGGGETVATFTEGSEDTGTMKVIYD